MTADNFTKTIHLSVKVPEEIVRKVETVLLEEMVAFMQTERFREECRLAIHEKANYILRHLFDTYGGQRDRFAQLMLNALTDELSRRLGVELEPRKP